MLLPLPTELGVGRNERERRGGKGRDNTKMIDSIERGDGYQFVLEKGRDLSLEGWSLEGGA